MITSYLRGQSEGAMNPTVGLKCKTYQLEDEEKEIFPKKRKSFYSKSSTSNNFSGTLSSSTMHSMGAPKFSFNVVSSDARQSKPKEN